jgi:arylsulfatase A-like enzyme
METARQVWQSDNGGAVHLGGGANAWPLRGGYFNNWEGGVRVAALVSGGFLPDHVRGTKLQEPMHEADWCACCSPHPCPRDASRTRLAVVPALAPFPVRAAATRAGGDNGMDHDEN